MYKSCANDEFTIVLFSAQILRAFAITVIVMNEILYAHGDVYFMCVNQTIIINLLKIL